MRMRSRGEWIGPGKRVIRNDLQQAAFDMIGDFFVAPDGPRPAVIGLARSNGEVFISRPASFSRTAITPGPGVEITGTATFSSRDIDEAAHFVVLGDNLGNVLAEAVLDPPLPSGQSVIIRRKDYFVEDVS